MSAPAALLAVNAGSSSLKFALFALEHGQCVPRWRGSVEAIGAGGRASAPDGGGRAIAVEASEGAFSSHERAVEWMLAWIEPRLGGARLAGAGHRVVHGGESFTAPIVIDGAALRGIEALAPLAPLHQLHNAAAIRSLVGQRPDLPQVACFDTAFHATLPESARRLALPEALTGRGLRRYGFHGLSYEGVAEGLPRLLQGEARERVIVAHLGNGASLCALRDGVSVDTTMGLTPLDGLVMGTRAGSLDPGVLLHLLREEGYDEPRLAHLLYHESGLKGVSGISGDMRALLDSAAPRARLAVELFVHRLVREIGALAATLEGLDALVFTGGIGERAATIRALACERLRWLGVALDPEANAEHRPRLTQAGSRVSAWIVPADEERTIARHAARLLRPG